MKRKLVEYKVLEAEVAHRLGEKVMQEFRWAEGINKERKKENNAYRLEIELVGGGFYARERYCQAVAKYEISEEA